MQQLEAQATALEIWQQKRPAPFENFWVTEFANEDDDDDELPYYYDTEQIQCHCSGGHVPRARPFVRQAGALDSQDGGRLRPAVRSCLRYRAAV